jgi:tetratricopeptide (TPR) repeat protein
MTSIEKHRPSVLSVKKMFANETLERRPVRRSFSQVERPRHRGADHGPTLANQTQHRLATLHNNFGQVLLQLGNREGAIREFQNALKLEPNNDGIQRRLRDLGVEVHPE